MKGYRQFCPVAVACEVFAQRWTPLILRELFSGGHTFNEIHRGLPLISRTLLSERLRQLEDAGVVECTNPRGAANREYRLTPAGTEFRSVIEGLGHWGQRWTVRVQRGNLDAGLLMWNVRRRMAIDKLPDRRIVAHVKFNGVPRASHFGSNYWLIIERPHVELCTKDPGIEPDLAIEADLDAFAGAWIGDVAFSDALRDGRIRIRGPASLAKAFPSWLLFSHYAKVPRPALVE
jgi:DNA-binding HxlR family transcriptional regulator